jgi:ATP-dependent Clp protease adaptor protein ClpS
MMKIELNQNPTGMGKEKTDIREKTLKKEKTELQEPPLYKVLLHNDDYTTMDFVVMILETVFHKDTGEATRIMLNVHHQGLGIAGVYTREVGETKVAIVHDMARKNQFPLKCSLEKVTR